jgi:hypothetical protein
MNFPNNYCGECPMWLAIDENNYEEILVKCESCPVINPDDKKENTNKI